jgi:hypothetical protein
MQSIDLHYVAKLLLSAAVIVAVTEVARRSSFWAAALASLPLTSLLAFVWLRLEGQANEEIARLASGIFWLVLPSLALFVVFPALLRAGVHFWASLALGCAVTAALYFATVRVLSRFGVSL